MAYWRVIFKGSLGTVETWSTSVAYGIVGLAPDVPDQATTDAMAQAIVGIAGATIVPSALRTGLSTQGSVDMMRVEKRAEDESILNVAERLFSSPLVGSSAPTKTPQDSVVISLRTSTPGARGRGRMYWPALAMALSSTFQLTTPTPAAFIADAKISLQAINTAMDGVYISQAAALRVALSVRSTTDHVCRDVTALQCGSVLDTQRRRRDNLPESYSSVVYP